MPKTSLLQKIEKVLNKSIRPKLSLHQGGVEVLKVDEKKGEVVLKFTGVCEGCSFAGLTFQGIVEGELMSQIPKLKKILVAGLELEE